MPALAVVGADHQIIRSTETFRDKCANPAALCETSPELDLVLRGQTDTAVIDLGDFSLAVEAVTDAAGRRSAMLSLPADDLDSDSEAPLGALREAADASPALVWAKDLDGRYLYANARYVSDLNTSEERLKGSSDADLPPIETVDGPRLRYVDDGLEEPLQLEYNVPALESRPPMVAFRFPLRNGRGQPIATCGVAAPSNEAQIARDEAVRLMQLERWNRLDPNDVRAELLEQWHVQVTPGPVEDVKVDPPVQARNGHAKMSLKLQAADKPLAAVELTPAPEPVAPEVQEEEGEQDAAAELDALDQRLADEADTAPADRDAPAASAAPDPLPPKLTLAGEDEPVAYAREEEWVRQLRQSAQMAPDGAAQDTADALQSDLQLARKWAERADQLQGDLHEAHARIRELEAEKQQAVSAAQAEATQVVTAAQAEAAQLAAAAQAEVAKELAAAQAEAQQADAAAQLAAEEAARLRTELEQVRVELEREKTEAQAARSEVEVARHELDAARAQAESFRAPADAALSLSEELGRALAAEQERGDELAQTLARIRARLGDLEGAMDRDQGRKQKAG